MRSKSSKLDTTQRREQQLRQVMPTQCRRGPARCTVSFAALPCAAAAARSVAAGARAAWPAGATHRRTKRGVTRRRLVPLLEQARRSAASQVQQLQLEAWQVVVTHQDLIARMYRELLALQQGAACESDSHAAGAAADAPDAHAANADDASAAGTPDAHAADAPDAHAADAADAPAAGTADAHAADAADAHAADAAEAHAADAADAHATCAADAHAADTADAHATGAADAHTAGAADAPAADAADARVADAATPAAGAPGAPAAGTVDEPQAAGAAARPGPCAEPAEPAWLQAVCTSVLGRYPLLDAVDKLDVRMFGFLRHMTLDEYAALWRAHLSEMALLMSCSDHADTAAQLLNVCAHAIALGKAGLLLNPALHVSMIGYNMISSCHEVRACAVCTVVSACW